MQRVLIIGVGRVGGALALALSENYKIEKLISRNSQKAAEIADRISPKPEIRTLENLENISGNIVFISTQDSEIQNVCEKLFEIPVSGNPFVFHTSGSLSSEILEPLQKKGYRTGSFHPLVSISDSFIGAERFNNSYFCIEGEDEALKTAEKIVGDLGGKPFFIETKYKALYHASAVTACGHLVALIHTAVEMLEICGVSESDAKEIFMPLVKSTVENLEKQSFSEALTGTFARGDTETLERHIRILQEKATQEQLDIYLRLGEQSLKLAERNGIDEKTIKRMTSRISLAKKNFRC